MDIKKIIRIVAPIVTGALAAGLTVFLTRPSVTVHIDPDYDVPTDDEHLDVTNEPVTVAVPRPRKPKTV
jgi:hypothetical protein